MPRTKLEKQIRHERTRKGMLVPLLEDLFKGSVEIESDEDVAWIEALLKKHGCARARRGTSSRAIHRRSLRRVCATSIC